MTCCNACSFSPLRTLFWSYADYLLARRKRLWQLFQRTRISARNPRSPASYSYQALDMRAGVRVVYFPPHGGCQGEVARPERSPMVAGSKRRRNLVSIFISDYGWLPWPIISQVRVLYQRARKLPMRPLIYRNLTQSAPICARHTSKRWKICLVRGFAGPYKCSGCPLHICSP